MNATEFKAAGRAIYGWGWQSRLAQELGRWPSTVGRWARGETPVPPPVAAFVDLKLKLKRQKEAIGEQS